MILYTVVDYYISGNELYKIKTDGTGRTKIDNFNSNRREINIVGDWIFYNNYSQLFKIKTDGTGNTELELDKN